MYLYFSFHCKLRCVDDFRRSRSNMHTMYDVRPSSPALAEKGKHERKTKSFDKDGYRCAGGHDEAQSSLVCDDYYFLSLSRPSPPQPLPTKRIYEQKLSEIFFAAATDFLSFSRFADLPKAFLFFFFTPPPPKFIEVYTYVCYTRTRTHTPAATHRFART